MRRINLTLRLKISLSLIGTVVLLLGILLLAVRGETSRQITLMTEQTQTRADRAFEELEHLYHQELLRFAKRISEKNRVPAALQAAVEEGDAQILIDAAGYELNLAQIPLAIFTDETGKPVMTLLDGMPIDTVSSGLPPGQSKTEEYLQVDKLLSSETASVSGYAVIKDRLFSTHGIALFLFRNPIGTMTIGFPVNRQLAERMSKVTGAEVAFLLKDKLLTSAQVNRVPGLIQQMTRSAGTAAPRTVKLEGNRWLLLDAPLVPEAPQLGQRILALSLAPHLDPLRRIENVFTLAGILALMMSIALGFSISRSLTAPVKRLVEATGKIAKGDYNARVEIRSKDELSSLGESFNRMSHGLQLKEQYRGILDKVVSPEVAEEMVKGDITLGGENREVTTLFADVRGFTAMTEDMEPQEVIAMLNQYMEQAATAIEAEGGVVDKYVGDEVMAIFGAPIQKKDDPLRAVRAALKIKENIAILNKKREATNEPGIKVGIGINTGIAVAGNMGSVNRLNYTVLGESVNIAARLCSQAQPGEILVSGETFKQTQDHIQAKERPIDPMKGISKGVNVFNVTGFKRQTATAFNTLMLCLLIFLFSFAPLAATPGVQWISPEGQFQINISGRLQLTGFVPQDEPTYLIYDTDPFVAGQLSLFTDLFWGERLYGLVELRMDRGEIPANESLKVRLEQAFIRYTLLKSRRLHIQVGKFVSPFGEYSQRHDSIADPFIRPPLLHEYRTMICPGIAPGRNDGFIAWKDRPWVFRPTGAPIIWGVPYQFGLMVFGGFGDISFRAALMNSAPSSDPVQWDLDLDQNWNYSWVGHLAWHINPELTIGVSFNYGPYSLAEIVDTFDTATGSSGYYEEEHSINDYNQILWGFNLHYQRGRMQLRAELMLDTWQVPNVIQNPKDTSYYIEIMYKFLPGLYGAFRYNGIHFNRIALTDGSNDQWDYNVQRYQFSMGYRFSPKMELKAEYQLNHESGLFHPQNNLFALQWLYRF